MKTIRTRLRDHPQYPYGTKPTFRPDMIKPVGTKSKWLIALNFMGDVGGDWEWRIPGMKGRLMPEVTAVMQQGSPPIFTVSSEHMAIRMRQFAILNPQHIILLLTKNPSWYRLAEWPDNCYCGFTATNFTEQMNRTDEIDNALSQRPRNIWISLEPWLDDKSPIIDGRIDWYVIGGMSGKNPQFVSEATWKWLLDKSIKPKRFTKMNAGIAGPREYPGCFKVQSK